MSITDRTVRRGRRFERNIRILTDMIRRVWKVVIVVVLVYFGLSTAYYWVENNTPCLYSLTNAPTCHQLQFADALWWGIVTLSTVGYGDIVPHTLWGRVIGAVLMIFQIGFLGYLLSVILGAVTETRLKVLLGSMGTDMRGHVVVAGYSAVGKAAVRELIASKQSVAVICENQEEVPLVQALGVEGQVFGCYGSINSEEAFRRANVGDCEAVIFTTEDDTNNLIGALNVRAIYPKVRVVVSVRRVELRHTLKAAGVTYVATPSDMGGRLCASAAFRPDVATAVEDLTTATYGADIQEYQVRPNSPIVGLTFAQADAKVRAGTGCILIGIIRAKGELAGGDREYETAINPPVTVRFDPGTLALVVGSLENLGRFEQWYGIPQGR